MSQFKYTLPSGKKFIVNGPDGATQLQADKIFYEQVAAGSLIGYQPGDTLTNPQIEFQKFGLSRLDRGTAGVEDNIILAAITGLPIVVANPKLIAVPVTEPITQVDVGVVSRGLKPTPVGPLTPTEVEAIEAQKINIVEQDYRVITREKGIGKYGFNCIQLEKTGYVKPSTSQIFLGVISENQPNPANFVLVMQSPSIWTGKNGVIALQNILDNEQLQNQIYNELMLLGYQALVANGTIVERNTTAVDTTVSVEYIDASPFADVSTTVTNGILEDSGALINLAATYGPEAAASWASGQSVPDISLMNSLAKSSQGAINFALNFLSGLVTGVKSAVGYANTINRDTVDGAVSRILGNPKIQSPTYAPPQAGSFGDIKDIQSAQQFITNTAKNLIG
jgi:hypothetical protein